MAIARFKFFITVVPFSLLLAAFIYGYWLPLSYPGGLVPFLQDAPQDIGYVAIAWLCAPFGIAFSCAVLYRVFFKRRVALWRDKDAIVYIHKLYQNMPIRDIREVSLIPAPEGSSRLIAFEMASGKTLRVGTITLVESVEEVLGTLQKMGLPVVRPDAAHAS